LITDAPMTGHRDYVDAQVAQMEGDRISAVPHLVAPGTARTAPAIAPSFDDVYDAHFPFVWRSVRRLGVPDESVDDVVQEIFVVVHRRLASFEGRSSLKSWLFGIALHTVRDRRRTLRRKPAMLGGRARADEGDLDAIEASGVAQDEALARAEATRLLHRVLDAMADERREVFILAELEQMSVPEIADAIGANVNTTYSRLRAARADFEQAVARARAGDDWRLR
jgi:RNA polymerase sigma-70 factor (ECF subfamily)